jgi:uncharacterized cofD-like protein
MTKPPAGSIAQSTGLEEQRGSPKVVALGGGHGLFASLSALRRITAELTAVVTVADDGGSSGRIRRELGVLPPGDLRMALAALAGPSASWRPGWAALLQHRFGGSGALAGHPVGNLLLTGLLEEHDDPVQALDVAGSVIGAVGRVLPMSPVPLDLIADVTTFEPDDPVRSRRIRGQSAIATTLGQVRDIRIVPADAPACPAVLAAIEAADVVVLGPGSWYTSVIPHLLLPDLAAALTGTAARVIVTVNLVPQPGETDGFSASQHLRVLNRYAPDLRISAVVADIDAAPDRAELERYCADLDAALVVQSVVDRQAPDRHDPALLADALRTAIDRAVARSPRPGDGA